MDHFQVKFWIAGKLTKTRDPMTKEPAQEVAAEELQKLLERCLVQQSGRGYLFTGHLMDVGKFKDQNG